VTWKYRFWGVALPLMLIWGATLAALFVFPERIPAHWGPSGLDRVGPKTELLTLPVLASAFPLLILFFARRQGEAGRLAAAIVAWTFAIIQLLVIAITRQSLARGEVVHLPGPATLQVGELAFRAVMGLVGLSILAIGVTLAVAPPQPNRYFGFRTEETLSDPVVWEKANRYAGRVMAMAGAAGAVAALFLPGFLTALVLVAGLLIDAACSVHYARKIARKEEG